MALEESLYIKLSPSVANPLLTKTTIQEPTDKKQFVPEGADASGAETEMRNIGYMEKVAESWHVFTMDETLVCDLIRSPDGVGWTFRHSSRVVFISLEEAAQNAMSVVGLATPTMETAEIAIDYARQMLVYPKHGNMDGLIELLDALMYGADTIHTNNVGSRWDDVALKLNECKNEIEQLEGVSDD